LTKLILSPLRLPISPPGQWKIKADLEVGGGIEPVCTELQSAVAGSKKHPNISRLISFLRLQKWRFLAEARILYQ
jgi:hypothetical protein